MKVLNITLTSCNVRLVDVIRQVSKEQGQIHLGISFRSLSINGC